MTEASVISVLHVDDDPAFADMTAEMLSEHEAQFTVETAMNASEGRDRLATHSFDCIVSDYEMPGQNGIEFLETIREKHPDLPFILYTGKGSEAVASDAIAAGVTDYLQKESGTSQYTVLANKIRNAVERYRQRERAQATRDRLRQIIDLLPQLVFVKDETGEFLLANEATADAYGTTVSNLEGATDADFADSKSEIEQFRADDQAVIESSEPKHIPEESLTTADGETRLLETTKISYDPVERDADAVLGVSMDITERKEREAELKMQSAAMEAAMDGISLLNEDGEYIYMNQAHADVFEYDADELLGSTWRRLYDDDETARIEQEVFPVLEREGEWRGEAVGKRRDGSPVYQEITLSLLDGGKLICTNRDITKRKEREQELRAVRERFERFASNVRDAFFLLPADYSETEYANPAVETIYGITPEEAYNDPTAWLQYVHPEDKDGLLTHMEAQQDGTAEWPVEQVFRIDHPDRGVRWVQAHLDVITDENGDLSRVAGVTTDITDLKEHERELERKQEFLEQTQNVANVGGWELDLRTESLRWTDEVYRIHGVGPEFEPTVEDAIAFYHPEDQTTIRDAVERVTTEGEPYDLELRIVTADDEVRWVSARGEPRYEDGEIVGVRGTFQDITDRIEREQELHEERAFIERSLDTLEDIFYFVDPDGDFQRWNSKLPALTGYSNEEIGSMNALEFFDGEHREALSHSIQEILETGPHVTEAAITTADGRQVPHEFRGVRMTNDDGEPTGIIGIARDITERRERERRLEQQTEELDQLATKYERQYRTLFEEAPVMTILTRSEDGRPIIEDCNSQFVETLGYDANTVIGSELAEFYTPESAERLRSQGYSQALNGQFTREKRELLTIDGEVIEALLRAVPRRRAGGEIIGTVAMYIDISERVSVKRANERLEEFTSVVSHDLRNPLNVATGRLELATEECDSTHLNDLEGALDRMGTLIDDLLLLAREGKEVTDAQPVDLATIVNGCWENVETNQASLITTIDRGVWADRTRLKQVFENLFRNAVEHGRADVTVTIGGLNDGFYIDDDGPGIPSDERDAVFEAGYSQSTDGTGFGLSIVEQIVTAHDWNIRVTDGADGGARFEITNVEFVATENSASSKYQRENS
jgi:PAS domain S-box-containing protein